MPVNFIVTVTNPTGLPSGPAATKMNIGFPQRIASFHIHRVILDAEKQLANKITIHAFIPARELSSALSDHLQPLLADQVEFDRMVKMQPTYLGQIRRIAWVCSVMPWANLASDRAFASHMTLELGHPGRSEMSVGILSKGKPVISKSIFDSSLCQSRLLCSNGFGPPLEASVSEGLHRASLTGNGWSTSLPTASSPGRGNTAPDLRSRLRTGSKMR